MKSFFHGCEQQDESWFSNMLLQLWDRGDMRTVLFQFWWVQSSENTIWKSPYINVQNNHCYQLLLVVPNQFWCQFLSILLCLRFKWLCRPELVLQAYRQYGQLYGRSPVCIWMCFLTSYGRGIILEQIGQAYFATPSLIGKICNDKQSVNFCAKSHFEW